MTNTHMVRAIRKIQNEKLIRMSILLLVWELACCVPGLVFLFCGLAYFVSAKTWHFWKVNNSNLEETAHICYLVSACVNPVLYLYHHKDFKTYMCKVFTRRRNEIQPLQHDLLPAKRMKPRFVPRTAHAQDGFKLTVYSSPKKTSEWIKNLDRRSMKPKLEYI